MFTMSSSNQEHQSCNLVNPGATVSSEVESASKSSGHPTAEEMAPLLAAVKRMRETVHQLKTVSKKVDAQNQRNYEVFVDYLGELTRVKMVKKRIAFNVKQALKLQNTRLKQQIQGYWKPKNAQLQQEIEGFWKPKNAQLKQDIEFLLQEISDLQAILDTTTKKAEKEKKEREAEIQSLKKQQQEKAKEDEIQRYKVTPASEEGANAFRQKTLLKRSQEFETYKKNAKATSAKVVECKKTCESAFKACEQEFSRAMKKMEAELLDEEEPEGTTPSKRD